VGFFSGDAPGKCKPRRQAKVDDKVAADQRGHGLGVSMDVYANSDFSKKLEAVRKLEKVIQ
jgi:hypothetical protein